MSGGKRPGSAAPNHGESAGVRNPRPRPQPGAAFAAAGGVAVLELHGKTVFQARTAVDAALRRSRGVYRLRLIHGFHGGTALREFLQETYAANPQVLRLEHSPDGGSTDLVLREY